MNRLQFSPGPTMTCWSSDALLIDLSLPRLWNELEEILDIAYPHPASVETVEYFAVMALDGIAAEGESYRLQGQDEADRNAPLWAHIGNVLGSIADLMGGE